MKTHACENSRKAALSRLFALTFIATSFCGAVVCPVAAESTKMIRIWGDDAASDALNAAEAAYRLHHPDVTFDNRLLGSDTGIVGLYTDTADIAVLGRDIHPVETLAYTWVFKRGPVSIPIARGSLATARHSPAIAVVVRADNPIDRISLADLDAVLGVERKRGAATVLSTWGELGVTGGLAKQQVHVYARNVEKSTAAVIRDKIMLGSRKWRWDHLTEFDDRAGPTGQPIDADDLAFTALEADPNGMALGRPPVGNAHLKTIAVGDGKGSFVAPSRSTVVDETYPLARTVMAYARSGDVDKPGAPAREFLSFLLSEEGQAALTAKDVFLPLSPTRRIEALKTLSGSIPPRP